MPRLRAQTSVDLPLEEAQGRFDAFLASLRQRDGASRVDLRVPIDNPAFGVAIERAVRIQTRPSFNRNSISVEWAPEGTTIFPSFEGTLLIWSDGNPNVTYIDLDGSYDPPFGTAGQIFDAAIGQRIAQATAREFLKDLKDAVER